MTGPGGTTFQIDLNSEPLTTYELHFYWSPACDPSGFGEGKHFFAQTNVTTDGLGNIGLTMVSFPVTVPISSVLTATATHPGGSTSEFSPCSPNVVAAASSNIVTHAGLPHQPVGNATLTPQQDGTLQVQVPDGNGSNGAQIAVGGAEGWMGSLSNVFVSAGGSLKSLYMGHHGYMNAVQWTGETELRFRGPGHAEVQATMTPEHSFQLRVQVLSDDDQVLDSALIPNGGTYPLSLCPSNNTLQVGSVGVLRMRNGAPASCWQYSDDDWCGTRPPRWKKLLVFPEPALPMAGGGSGNICDVCPECCFPYYVAIDLIRIIPQPPCLSCPQVLFLGDEFVEIFGNLHRSIGSASLSPWLDFLGPYPQPWNNSQGPYPQPWVDALGPFPHPWVGGVLTVESLSVGGENGIDLIPSGSGAPLPPTDGGVDPHDASSLARYVSLDFNASGSPAGAVSWVRFIVEGPVPVGPGDPVEHILHFQASERGWAVSAHFGAAIAGVPDAMVQYYYHGTPVGQPTPLQMLQVRTLPDRVAASTSVSPTGAPGFDLQWAETISVEGPQPLPWDRIQITPMAANVIPWIARYRVRYDSVENLVISGEQTLPALPGPLKIERRQTSARLSYPTEPGRPYRVEFSDSLSAPAWQTLEEFLGDGSVHQVSDMSQPGSNRFYRLLGF
jgi:hypothetical protein